MTASSPESGDPCENAKPALVVTRAGNPSHPCERVTTGPADLVNRDLLAFCQQSKRQVA